MNTEETKTKKEPAPKKETVVISVEERKDELLTKKAKNRDRLSLEEEKELKQILAEEEAKRYHGALIFKLSERAEKIARKEESRLRRVVTDRVAKFGTAQAQETGEVVAALRASVKNLEKETEAVIQKIHKTKNEEKKRLEAEADKKRAEIRKNYAKLYANAEELLTSDAAHAAQQITEFKRLLQKLDVEQLVLLEKGDVIKLESGGKTEDEYISLPDPEPS